MKTQYVWRNSFYHPTDLDKKTVEFRIITDDGHTSAGVGWLVASNVNGLQVKIETSREWDGDKALVAGFIGIPADAAHKLIKNPAGSKTDFTFKS